MIIVTGEGPRVGTSFVMHKLRDLGFEVLGNKFTMLTPDGPLSLPEEGNPNGYYEAPHWDLSLFQGGKGVMKAWGPALEYYNFKPTGIIQLYRTNKFSQCASISEQSERELESMGIGTPPAQEIVDRTCDALGRWLDWLGEGVPRLRVQTEDLDYQLMNRIVPFVEDNL